MSTNIDDTELDERRKLELLTAYITLSILTGRVINYLFPTDNWRKRLLYMLPGAALYGLAHRFCPLLQRGYINPKDRKETTDRND